MLHENDLPATISLLSSQDLTCVGEAIQIIDNISFNNDFNANLSQMDTLKAIVQCLRKNDHNCQRYSSICLANLATNSLLQMKWWSGV